MQIESERDSTNDRCNSFLKCFTKKRKKRVKGRSRDFERGNALWNEAWKVLLAY